MTNAIDGCGPPLQEPLETALCTSQVELKLSLAEKLVEYWSAGALADRDAGSPVIAPTAVGRPARPQMVRPSALHSRPVTTREGRIALVHSIAHIEFNAVNLALDAAYRFREMPDSFRGDWLGVAAEEARHFRMLRRRLWDWGSDYGELPAHNGLWEAALRTAHDPLVRMALVPRVLEARGLDVAPGMIERLVKAGDEDTAAILRVILEDEVGHVRIGTRWFHHLCGQRGLEPEETYFRLLGEYYGGPARGPLHRAARRLAGFSESELDRLQAAGAAPRR